MGKDLVGLADDYNVDLRTLELRIARSENLPMLPEVAISILKMSQDPNTPTRSYEAVIERDAALSGKVLRVASSSYYAVGDIQNISRAVSILGANALKSLVLTISYQQMLSNDKRSKEFDRLDCWRHSLATAIGARIIAKYKMPSRAEEMYTAGLLHDVGLLVFDKFCPDQLDQAIRLSVKDRSPLHVAVFDTFGYHQGQVGSLLCLKWGLSKMIHTAILNHYDPKADPNDLESACILSASNALAFECGCYNNSPVSDEGFDDSIVEILGFPQDQFLPICEMVRAEVDKAQSSFVPLKRAA